jgi:hypothetical protein
MATATPRGVRNNNPGNIRWRDPWQGLVPEAQRTDKDFCQFVSAPYGIRAIVHLLTNYFDKYKLTTITGIINRWAPTSENATAAYIADVAKTSGLQADEALNLHDYNDMRKLVEAIIKHENGDGPLSTENTWYDDATIKKGMALAGIQPTAAQVGAVPVTKESAAATVTGALGVAQLADVASQVSSTINHVNEGFTTGSTFQMILGVLLIGIAVFVAYSQVAKHKSGVM